VTVQVPVGESVHGPVEYLAGQGGAS
jgi:hypothetical protein